MEVRITVNADKLSKDVKAYSSQVPFVISKTLNNTALQVKKDVQDSMSKNFILRRPTFAHRSVKVAFSKKTNLTARVGIEPPAGAQDVFSVHEEGGRRVAKSGRIAVPLRSVLNVDVKRVIPKAKRPRRLANSFLTTQADGDKFIMIRKGRGKRAKVMPAYKLVPFVKLKPRLEFIKTAVSTIDRVWDAEWDKSWALAVSTAKSKGN